MMEAVRRPGRRLRALGVALAAATIGLTVPGPAVAQPAACAPPPVFPESELQPGMVGIGTTVVDGVLPSTFVVTILGVMPNGIAPGVDFVLVQVSGDAVSQAGGIAAGFSGSPVTIDGRLAGAISYVLGPDQTIGGMTPAQPMMNLFGDPASPSTAARAALAASTPPVRLSPVLRRVAAGAAGIPVGEISGTATAIPLPVAVSGLTGRAFGRFQKALARTAASVVPYSAGSAPAPTGSMTTLQPGSNFADVVSYGDVTFAAVGTTTAVCGDMAVAFGHPFFFDGASTSGLSGATVLAVERDPTGLYGSFKIANVTDPVGVVDQDRLAGVRGTFGLTPLLVPVTTIFSNPDLGTRLSGSTTVTRQDWVSTIAQAHVYGSLETAFDRIGEGTTSTSWVVQGVGPGGQPFTLARSGMAYDPSDAAWAGSQELAYDLGALFANSPHVVTFTKITDQGSITQAKLEARIVRVLSASSVQRGLRVRDSLVVRRGGWVRLLVVLQPAGSTRTVAVRVELRAPLVGPRTTTLVVRGGRAPGGFAFFGAPRTSVPFWQLLYRLQHAEQNNDLVAAFKLAGPVAMAPFVAAGPHERMLPQKWVVVGRRSIIVHLT